VRDGARVRRDGRVRGVRRCGRAVLRGHDEVRGRARMHRGRRVRDLRWCDAAVLQRGQHVHRGSHVHGQRGLRHVRRDGTGVLRGPDVHRCVGRVQRQPGQLDVRSVRRHRPALLHREDVRHGPDVPRRHLPVTRAGSGARR
jgi:hypothetical protein